MWKRIPKSVKEEGNHLNELWKISKALIDKSYWDAFSMIAALTKTLLQDSEKNGSTLKLVEVLNKVLREHHILNDVKSAYQTIELPKLKSLLGFAQEPDQVVTAFLTARGFKIDGTFVHIPHNIDEASSHAKRFKLDQERVQ